MKIIIMFIMLTLSILSLYSQDYCEGYGNSWRGKEKNFGNVPTYNIPITTGWVAFSPFTDEFNTFDYSKWTKKMGHVIQCHQILIFQVVLIMFT